MHTVYKYPIQVTDEQGIEMPLGSQILSIHSQTLPFGPKDEALCLWALVNIDENRKETRMLRIVGTGHPFEDVDKYKFICTTQQDSGRLVWHIFEQVVF